MYEQIWENPEKWWNNKDTQYCVAKFIDLYSKKPSKNFISKLKMIIKN